MSSGAPLPAPPYPGLASYGDDDAGLFFGRTREVELIIANLRAARLTVLYGPSGVGKSSLLHAGVVARLREEQRRKSRKGRQGAPRAGVIILDDWASDPAAQLAAEVRALAAGEGTGGGEGTSGGAEGGDATRGSPGGGGGDPGDTGDSRAWHAAITAYRAQPRGAILLILDQFEEYIRLHPDPRTQSFDDVISELVRDSSLNVRILIAIREDKLADLDRFGGQIPQLLGNVLRLGPLSPAAALEAIEEPIMHQAAKAREAGDGEITLEPGLAKQVRDELVALCGRRSRGPAAVPGSNGAGREPHVETSYLQLVMRKLWDEDIARRGGTQIGLDTLARLGGVDKIVSTHVETALASLPASKQTLAAEMLRHLVTPSGATVCLTAFDLSVNTKRPIDKVEALAERLSRAPARILRGVAAAPGASAAGGYELPQVLAEPALEWRTARLEGRATRLLLALVAMTAVAIALVGYTLDPGPLKRLELASVDARFDVRGAQPADSRIALVTFDGAEADKLAAAGRYRSTIARAIDAIAGADPSAVLPLAVFVGSRPGDKALLKAIHGPLEKRLVLSTDRFNASGEVRLFGKEILAVDSEPKVAYSGYPYDPGKRARRMERDVKLPILRDLPDGSKAPAVPLPTLGVAVAQIRDSHARPENLPATAWIAFRGTQGTFPRIPLAGVLTRRSDVLAKLRGKVVLIAENGEAAQVTSAPGAGAMDGTELQANMVSTALDGFPLRNGSRVLDIALVALLGLLPLGLALRLRPALVAPALLAGVALFCVAAQLAFGGGRVISVVYPLASLALASIGVAGVLLLRHLKTRAAKARAEAAPA